MSILNCLGRNDLIPVVANVLFFMIVQTLFFYYIASQQYETVLVSKLDFVKTMAEENKSFRNTLENLKKDFLEKNEKHSKDQKKLRDEHNKNLTKKYCGIPILIGLLMMTHLVFIMKTKRPWNSVDTLSLLFVLLAYGTEILFFIFIVRKYEFVGDQYIMSKLLTNILS